MMKRSQSVAATIALLVSLSFSIANVANAAQATEITRHMARGAAAMELAESPADFLDAVEEFSEAVKLAPDLDAAWFNLGLAQEMAEQYQASILSFRVYLEKSPQASDREAVEARIFGLEYKMENQTSQILAKESEELAKVTRAGRFTGYWTNSDARIRIDADSGSCRTASTRDFRFGGTPGDPQSCEIIADKIRITLTGHPARDHGFDYDIVCDFELLPGGGEMTGEYVRGARLEHRKALCGNNLRKEQ